MTSSAASAPNTQERFTYRFLERSEYHLWNRFILTSPQATVFSTPEFCDAYQEGSGISYRILGIFRGSELRGGFPFFEKQLDGKLGIPAPVSFVPYQTLHWPPYQNRSPLKGVLESIDAVKELSDYLSSTYERIGFSLHPSIIDIRPFQWYRYHSGGFYSVSVRYTSYLDISSESTMWETLHSHRRGDIRRAEKQGIRVEERDDFETFTRLYRATFVRQGIEIPDHEIEIIRSVYSRLKKANLARMYFSETSESIPTSAVILIWYRDEVYYYFGGSDPQYRNTGSGSYLFWRTLVANSGRFARVDMVGINSPQRGWFKLSFGGNVVPYFVISH